MAYRHATALNHNVYICILVSFLLPIGYDGAAEFHDDPRNTNDDGRRLTREYHLRQGALRGLIIKPSRQYDMQNVEMFLGIPYAAAPVGNLRFMPPVSAPPWSGVKMATHFAPVCPQSMPQIKKGNPPSLGRQHYLNRIKPFLKHESEDCLYLNIYVPFREQKTKKFPVLVFVHGDSFEWSSGNPYDGRILSAYGNIMVITINYRLGILGFMKPSLTEHVYGNNGLLDQLAALQWIKDNIEDLNGDPHSVTIMGHGTGAACVNFLMLSPISNGLFHRAILMSGSALSDWAMTKDPTQYTLQVAQSLGCNPSSKNMMTCLQNKPLSDIKRVQILSREFETPLGPIVAGSFIPNEPVKTMESFPNLLSKYQLLSGVVEAESYHDFGVIELDHGILENQRDEFITKLAKIRFDAAEDIALKEILKQYAPSKLDPQRWNVETNRDVIMNLFSDARTLAPVVSFANYQSKSNPQSYFYVFGHNSVSTDYAPLNKSVKGEDLPYVFGIPLGSTTTHFHTQYTQKEKLLSEVVMRLWTNFVKIGTPNTQSVNEYFTLDKKQWSQYNVEWPEYNTAHQSYLRLDIPPYISSLYRSNYTKFWIESLPNKMRRYIVDPLFEFTSSPTTQKPKPNKNLDSGRKIYTPPVVETSHYNSPSYGKLRPYSPPERKPDTDMIYREIQSIKIPSRPVPPRLIEKAVQTTTKKPNFNIPVKASSAPITLIVSLCILFLSLNIGICAILYFKKRRRRLQERSFENIRHPCAEIGEVDIIGQKSSNDRSALQTLKNGCNAIKSMKISNIRGNSKNSKKKLEPCKTPKSDDSGGFRERFQLRRHLSTSTLDAHTKVRDWITNEVIHRCSPNVLKKSQPDLINDEDVRIIKPFTRSEELLSESKNQKKDFLKGNTSIDKKCILTKTNLCNKNTSEKTTSTSALGSHTSLNSNKHSINSIKQAKSSDSLRSRGTESMKSKKVSVAIDATPAARTSSVLQQKPIEISKSFENVEKRHSKTDVIETKSASQEIEKKFTNEIVLSLHQQEPLKISHKHSSSDPVTDFNYVKSKEKMDCGIQVVNIPPPITFRNDINMTSQDDNIHQKPLTAAEALLTIQRRNFPKVLPDLPKSQKRLSLQPNSLLTFKNYASYGIDNNSERSKIPPQPPPRTTTLERRLAYKNSKILSSFEVPRKISETDFNTNYENVENFTSTSNEKPILFNTTSKNSTLINIELKEKQYPKVIIASSDIPNCEPTIVINPSKSDAEIMSNVVRVRLPDDFHSHTSDSITSYSSFCSDDDIDDINDELVDDFIEDKLIQELVGGVESPTNIEDVLDSKGPETIFEKKLEIVPVKVNPGYIVPKNKEDYVCITDLCLPDLNELEKTAQIKPNFGLNKLQKRSECIQKPLEKSIRLKQKRRIKPKSILNRSFNTSKCDTSKLEHSTSGSSNDTETSTGTVKKVEVKKEK